MEVDKTTRDHVGSLQRGLQVMELLANHPAGLTLNNNDYHANGTGAVFGFFNSLDVANLAAWRVASHGCLAASAGSTLRTCGKTAIDLDQIASGKTGLRWIPAYGLIQVMIQIDHAGQVAPGGDRAGCRQCKAAWLDLDHGRGGRAMVCWSSCTDSSAAMRVR